MTRREHERRLERLEGPGGRDTPVASLAVLLSANSLVVVKGAGVDSPLVRADGDLYRVPVSMFNILAAVTNPA